MTDSLIKCWQLKRDVGFWRPVEAVPAAGDDGNPDTRPAAGWTPLLAPTPPYSDYVSGHGCVTSPQVEVIKARFGETIPSRAALERRPDPAHLRHPGGARARRPQLPHLGRAPLPRRDVRRVPNRAQDRTHRDAGDGVT